MKRTISFIVVFSLIVSFGLVFPVQTVDAAAVVLSPDAETQEVINKSFKLFTFVGGLTDDGRYQNFADIENGVVQNSYLKDEKGNIIDHKQNITFGDRKIMLHTISPEHFKESKVLKQSVTVSGKFKAAGDSEGMTATVTSEMNIAYNDQLKIKVTPELLNDRLKLHVTTEGQDLKPAGSWYVSVEGEAPYYHQNITKTVHNQVNATVEFTKDEFVRKFLSGNESNTHLDLPSIIQQSPKRLRVNFRGKEVKEYRQIYTLNLYVSDFEKVFKTVDELRTNSEQTPKPQPEQTPKPDPKPDSKPNPNPQPKPEPQLDPKPDSKQEPKLDLQAASTKSKPDVNPKSDANPQPNQNQEQKPTPTSDPTPKPKVKPSKKTELKVEACFDRKGKLQVNAALPEAQGLEGEWKAAVGDKQKNIRANDKASFTFEPSEIQTEDGKIPLVVTYKAKKRGKKVIGVWKKELVQIEVEGQPLVKDGKLTFRVSLKDVKDVEEGKWKITSGGKTEEKEGKEKIDITLDASGDQSNPQGTTDFETGKEVKIEFSGKVAGKEIEGCLKDTIQPVSENEDEETVEKTEVKNQQVPNQQAGGQLPKTATAYGFNLWLGILLIIMGISIGVFRRFVRS